MSAGPAGNEAVPGTAWSAPSVGSRPVEEVVAGAAVVLVGLHAGHTMMELGQQLEEREQLPPDDSSLDSA